MRKAVVEIGQRFGRLVVIKKVTSSACRKTRYECHCDCGKTIVIQGGNLKNGKTRSCRCWANTLSTTHGGSQDPEYKLWHGMLERCRNPNASGYKRYGGSGIHVCKCWQKSYAHFLNDVGRRPSMQHTLERINNSRGYYPNNVRWATRKEQANNRRTNRQLIVAGVTKTVSQWATVTGIPEQTIHHRIRAGWSATACVTPQRLQGYKGEHLKNALRSVS